MRGDPHRTSHTATKIKPAINRAVVHTDLQLEFLVSLGHPNQELLIVNHSRGQLVVLHHGLSCLHKGHLQKGLAGKNS